MLADLLTCKPHCTGVSGILTAIVGLHQCLLPLMPSLRHLNPRVAAPLADWHHHANLCSALPRQVG